jgi:hypothetical protein
MMGGAVVAESSFRHQFFLTGSGGPLGRVGLFVRPMDTAQPTRMVVTQTRAERRAKRRRFTVPAYHGLSVRLTRRTSNACRCRDTSFDPGVLGRCHHEGCAEGLGWRDDARQGRDDSYPPAGQGALGLVFRGIRPPRKPAF